MSKWVGLMLTGWILIVSCLLLFAASSRLVPFDQNNRFSDATASMSFDIEFSRSIKLQYGLDSLASSVIVFSSGQCFCETLAKPHIQQLLTLAKNQAFKFQQFNISQSPLAHILPATPAVAVWDQNDNLTYLGPLSAGAICVSSNDLVSRYINRKTRPEMPGAAIVSDAQGCYCST